MKEKNEKNTRPEVQKRKRRFGDRYDGYRVRNLDLPYYIIPHIMTTRSDSQNFFNCAICVDNLEKYVREKKKEIPELRTFHVALAAIVRLMGTRPQLNRFVAGKKIFARNRIRISMSIKRSLADDGEETEIMPDFSPYDTLADVVEKFNICYNAAFNNVDNDETGTDKTNRILGHTPTFIKTFFVWLMRNFDKIGIMPKFINEVSPFHSSAYFTDVGSLGVDSIYHHLYNFGTVSLFCAMGKKEVVKELEDDGTVSKHKYINFRFVVDERVCDGYYYARSLRQFKRYIANPELLEEVPTDIPLDL